MLALSISIGLSMLADVEDWRAALTVCLLAVHTLCLAGRRIWPLPVLAINVVSGLAVSALGFHLVVLGPAGLIAVYTVASTRPRKMSLPAALLTIAGATLALRGSDPGTDPSTYIAFTTNKEHDR